MFFLVAGRCERPGWGRLDWEAAPPGPVGAGVGAARRRSTARCRRCRWDVAEQVVQGAGDRDPVLGPGHVEDVPGDRGEVQFIEVVGEIGDGQRVQADTGLRWQAGQHGEHGVDRVSELVRVGRGDVEAVAVGDVQPVHADRPDVDADVRLLARGAFTSESGEGFGQGVDRPVAVAVVEGQAAVLRLSLQLEISCFAVVRGGWWSCRGVSRFAGAVAS
ncbi:hypothetical protein ABT187_49745, partial [Streptomyces sp. NPDC001817]|uniref:hypothetical protein n=1 Tax=Streptomyces sp. NPDC001817 TaxID=3154398 RepID=UPI0033279FFA